VRHFYYRIIKKINKILKPNKIDNKDQREVIIALLCFWEVKRGVTEKEEYTKEFANCLRDMISKRTTELQRDESHQNLNRLQMEEEINPRKLSSENPEI